MASARLSSSPPNSLVVPVRRAIRPSSMSRTMAQPMSGAASSYWPCSVLTIAQKPRNRLPVVKRAGSSDAPRWKGAGEVERGEALKPASLALAEDRDPALDAVPDLGRHLELRREEDVHPAPELDHAHALAPRHRIARALGEHDAPGDEAGDLLEDHGGVAILDGHRVLLVARGGLVVEGGQE